MAQEFKKVVIIGGGFAVINLIKRLASDQRFHITLVDLNNYQFFPPLLYQVATAFIEPSNISYPFRRMFQDKDNLRFRSEEHMSELPSLMRISYAVFCLKKNTYTYAQPSTKRTTA